MLSILWEVHQQPLQPFTMPVGLDGGRHNLNFVRDATPVQILAELLELVD